MYFPSFESEVALFCLKIRDEETRDSQASVYFKE